MCYKTVHVQGRTHTHRHVKSSSQALRSETARVHVAPSELGQQSPLYPWAPLPRAMEDPKLFPLAVSWERHQGRRSGQHLGPGEGVPGLSLPQPVRTEAAMAQSHQGTEQVSGEHRWLSTSGSFQVCTQNIF